MTSSIAPQNKIHLLYFVCGRHFQCLRISLESLRLIGMECIGTVYLYVDRDDFFTDAQIERLHRLVPRLVIRKGDNKTTGLGEQAIVNQAGVYVEVGADIGPDDYLAKVDSDILFVSAEVLREVLYSGDDAVGQVCDYWEPFLFFQGGCYFIKGSLLSAFASFDTAIMPSVLAGMNNETARAKGRVFTTYTEDAVVYSFLATRTERIRLTRYYGAERDICDLRTRFSMIHFQQARPIMERNAARNAARVWLRRRLTGAGAMGQLALAPIRGMDAALMLILRVCSKARRMWSGCG